VATLEDYKGIQIVSPAPTGQGGLAIQNDLKKLADWNPKSVYGLSTDPGGGDDSSDGFLPGSLWLNTSASPHRLWVCLDATLDNAVWKEVAFDPATYALLAGRAGGQVLKGGTAAGENLTLASTANATKGKILFGNSAYDGVNNRLGLGTTAPAQVLDVHGQGIFSDALTIAVNSITVGSGGASSNIQMVPGGGDLGFVNTNGGQLNVDQNGVANIRRHDGTTPTTLATVDSAGNLGIGTTNPGAKLEADAGAAGTTAFVVQAAVSQAATLLEVQDSAGNLLSSFNKAGYLMTRKTSGPANTDLAKPELTIWLDQSGTSVGFKAKDGGGTVRTGNVALT
jgi:hypothetical protein